MLNLSDRVSADFFLIGEDTLACDLSIKNSGASPQDIQIFGLQRLELGESSWWGRDGISGSYDEHEQHSMYYPDPLNSALSLRASIAPGAKWTGKGLLSRAVDQHFAQQEISASALRVKSVRAERIAEDDRIWRRAPRLQGNFPAHWKNSWVYDFETLRMMVRRPIGLYKHHWDPTQIHAPRNVLAETSIDMWALGYADPASSQGVLLSKFQDALEANVPCMREDGTMNKVAADGGSACGTSVQRCYPFYCMESVFLRTADQAWLGKLYPYFCAFLDWTLKNRTDSEGWVVAKCSWESGMDASARFLIKQPTGGELIEFIRVAEIQAAMAHAAGAM